MQTPSAGIYISAGTAALAVSTTPLAITGYTGNQAGDTGGDTACVPDYANSRVLCHAPGTYRFALTMSGYADALADIIVRLRKNAIAITGLQQQASPHQKIQTLAANLSPASVSAAACEEQTLAYAGALATDIPLSLIKADASDSIGIGGFRIPSDGNVAIKFVNPTSGAVVPTAADHYFLAVARFGRVEMSLQGEFAIASADNPRTISAWTSSNTYNNSPSGVKAMCPVDLSIAAISGTCNFVVEYLQLNIARVLR